MKQMFVVISLILLVCGCENLCIDNVTTSSYSNIKPYGQMQEGTTNGTFVIKAYSSINDIKLNADKGDAVALYALAAAYANGSGVKKSEEDAFATCRKAASKGLPMAQYTLGVCYSEGRGIAAKPALAFQWFQKAAEQGLPVAQYRLGVCYAAGEGVERNENEAFWWYRRAARQGNAYAQNCMGECFANGRGVLRDIWEAEKWYKYAAEQGIVMAQNNLAVLYADKRSYLYNPEEAHKWLVKAAEGGSPVAQRNLGMLYTYGRRATLTGGGVDADLDKAEQWLTKAAESGDYEAKGRLAEIYYRRDDGRQDVAKAEKLLRELDDKLRFTEDKKERQLWFNVGKMLDEIEKDKEEKAKRVQRKAPKNHCSKCGVVLPAEAKRCGQCGQTF